MKGNIELLKMLYQIGYIACIQGLVRDGECIMEGLYAVRPEENSILVGLAIARMYTGRSDEAINILRNQVLVGDPNHRTAQLFLGIMLMDNSHQEDGEQLLRLVSDHGSENEQYLANIYLSEKL
jgi:predicted Zn-dependent protease